MTRRELDKYLAELTWCNEPQSHKFVVVYVNLFENTIEIEQVTAESDWHALIKSRFTAGITLLNDCDIPAIKSYFFDSDSIIEVKKLA
jgi:hypothetical protein